MPSPGSAGGLSGDGVTGLPATTTVNVRSALLPAASLPVQVTVVLPTGNVEPEAGVQATVGAGSSSSVTVGVA